MIAEYEEKFQYTKYIPYSEYNLLPNSYFETFKAALHYVRFHDRFWFLTVREVNGANRSDPYYDIRRLTLL